MSSALKYIWEKFLDISIFTQYISYVKFPRVISELGHNTVFMFWSRVSAISTSHYLDEFRRHNEAWRLYQITCRGSVCVCVCVCVCVLTAITNNVKLFVLFLYIMYVFFLTRIFRSMCSLLRTFWINVIILTLSSKVRDFLETWL